jgi:hypothetical protein
LTSIPRSSQTAALSGIDHKQEFERHREMVLPSLAGSSCSESRTAAPKTVNKGSLYQRNTAQVNLSVLFPEQNLKFGGRRGYRKTH